MVDPPEIRAIAEKLDILIRLLAMSLIDGKKQKDQLLVLSRVGFQPKQMADILGTTPNTVRVSLSHLRRQGKSIGKRLRRGAR